MTDRSFEAEQLSAGVYHVVSSLKAMLPAATRAATELKVLRVAAEGAKVGNANLVDVTNLPTQRRRCDMSVMVEAIEKQGEKKFEFGPIENRDIADGLVCQLAAQNIYASVKVREEAPQ